MGGGTFILHATRSPFNLQDSYPVRTGLVHGILSSKRDYDCVPSERVH